MAVRHPSAGAPHERTQLLVVVSIPADDDDLHVWQVRSVSHPEVADLRTDILDR